MVKRCDRISRPVQRRPPDRFHSAPESERLAATARYTALNGAYNTLKEPRDRLSLLLELELGAKPNDVQRIPPGTMDLFIEVGQLCRDVDAYLAQRSKITSPLLKVKSFEQGMEWTDKLQALASSASTRSATNSPANFSR